MVYNTWLSTGCFVDLMSAPLFARPHCSVCVVVINHMISRLDVCVGTRSDGSIYVRGFAVCKYKKDSQFLLYWLCLRGTAHGCQPDVKQSWCLRWLPLVVVYMQRVVVVQQQDLGIGRVATSRDLSLHCLLSRTICSKFAVSSLKRPGNLRSCSYYYILSKISIGRYSILLGSK